jgi:TolA-binding protein
MQAREFIGGMKKGGGAGLLLAVILVCGGSFSPSALASTTTAPSAEEQAFQNAFDRFHDSLYPLAETYFNDFLTKYTNSTHRADAILYLARARLYQSNYTGAIDLLQKSAAEAGGLKHEYLFWTAKARYASGDLTNAAEDFARVAREFPLSPRRLEAAYDQAEARSRMGDWPGVIGLLQQADGPFQLAAAQDGRSEFAGLGWLLLGEAFLHENRPAEGEKVVLGFDPAGLTQDLRWHRQYLLSRLQLASGRIEAALTTSSNALELALDPRHQAASVFLQGQILEKLGRPAEAIGVYAKNLVDSQTQEVQWEALSRTIPLTVMLNPLPQAIQALDTLLKQHPQTKAQDLAQLSLGELYLKACAIPPSPEAESNAFVETDTNFLANALTNFNIVITNFTNSPLLAKARLDRGWCDWLSGNVAAARADFGEAAAHLPFSQDQAIARFKLADAQFSLKDYSGAASNYRQVLANYDKFPEVTNALFDLALYQIAEADIYSGGEEGPKRAREAVEKILRWYPGSYFGDRGSLLVGEDLNRKNDYAKAREVFLAVLARSPHWDLLPKVEYEIARTHDYEGHWNEAITRYKQWETNHPGDPLLADVEFHLALACGKAGLTNDALMGFTNFVVRFPTNNTLAPWALYWLADFYYNQNDFISAEKYYQELFQNYPGAGDLAFQARFWAGKSALKRQGGTRDAHDYFVTLVNLTNAPAALVARGWFALGETFFTQYISGQTNEDYLGQAIAAVSKCTNGAPTNAIAVEALGRLGDYYMAWADQNPGTNNYAIAKQMYETIVNFPATSDGVSVAARSQAEIGLGLIAERQHLPMEALDHYFKVLDFSPGHFDPYWVERAGEFAAKVCEDQQHWNEAVKIYDRVLAAVPGLRPVVEKKRAADQARWDAGGN